MEYYKIPRRRSYQDPDLRLHPGSWIGSALLVLAILAWPVISFTTAHLNNRVQTITVTSKDDQSLGKSGHQYLIFTPQGVFKDTDNIWLGKWNSSDVYNQLQPRHTYRCHIHGERSHVTSGYPDIMSCTEVR